MLQAAAENCGGGSSGDVNAWEGGGGEGFGEGFAADLLRAMSAQDVSNVLSLFDPKAKLAEGTFAESPREVRPGYKPADMGARLQELRRVS